MTGSKAGQRTQPRVNVDGQLERPTKTHQSGRLSSFDTLIMRRLEGLKEELNEGREELRLRLDRFVAPFTLETALLARVAPLQVPTTLGEDEGHAGRLENRPRVAACHRDY